MTRDGSRPAPRHGATTGSRILRRRISARPASWLGHLRWSSQGVSLPAPVRPPRIRRLPGSRSGDTGGAALIFTPHCGPHNRPAPQHLRRGASWIAAGLPNRRQPLPAAALIGNRLLWQQRPHQLAADGRSAKQPGPGSVSRRTASGRPLSGPRKSVSTTRRPMSSSCTYFDSTGRTVVRPAGTAGEAVLIQVKAVSSRGGRRFSRDSA